MVNKRASAGYGHEVASAQTINLPARRLRIGESTVEVLVRRSRRARVARILLGPRRPLEAIVPPGMTMRQLDSFLASKRKWIAQKLAVVEAIASRPHQLGLDQPNTVWLAGEQLPVKWKPGSRPVARVDVDRTVSVGGATVEDAAAALLRLYRREATKSVREAVEQEAERLRLAPSSVAIRDQQTRWGSCSSRGNLSFSWRLVLAPPEVLRYVVVHELCHLREPSHSKRYWQILEAAFPGWQEPARWLRENGHELHAHSPSVS